MQGNYKSRIRVGDHFHYHFKPCTLGKAAAAAHYLSSALHKTAQASYNMALCYMVGRGTPKDSELADLFMTDVLKFDKEGKAKWPVLLTRRYFAVKEWYRRYGWIVVMMVLLWVVLFTLMVGALLLWEHYFA